jgi:hypothetical protein
VLWPYSAANKCWVLMVIVGSVGVVLKGGGEEVEAWQWRRPNELMMAMNEQMLGFEFFILQRLGDVAPGHATSLV